MCDVLFSVERGYHEYKDISIILVLTTWETLPMSYKVDTSVTTHLTEGIEGSATTLKSRTPSMKSVKKSM